MAFGRTPRKRVWVCDACESQDIHIKVWQNPNTSEVYGDAGDSGDCYCNDCDEEQRMRLNKEDE
tara:strand:- start:486 stop:677 length:192 start_codon:yes stop_codon:yes gene_type:complete